LPGGLLVSICHEALEVRDRLAVRGLKVGRGAGENARSGTHEEGGQEVNPFHVELTTKFAAECDWKAFAPRAAAKPQVKV